MIMAADLSSAFMLLMSRIVKYKSIADKINQSCAEQGCPPAFDIQLSPTEEQDDIHIRASEEYRFDGFGAVVGLPPQMSFWVHYVPQNGKSVDIGRFLIPIGIGDIAKL
jgi:hypothetical protein